MDGYRLIAESAYAGPCHGCGGRYEVGDPIWWAKWQPCYHESCGPDHVEGTPPPTGGTRTATGPERQTGAERVGEARLALMERQLADAARADGAIQRTLAALGEIVTDLLPAGDARLVRVTAGLEELRVALSTNPLDRAKREAEADAMDGAPLPF